MSDEKKHSCPRCGYFDPAVTDFHKPDPLGNADATVTVLLDGKEVQVLASAVVAASVPKQSSSATQADTAPVDKLPAGQVKNSGTVSESGQRTLEEQKNPGSEAGATLALEDKADTENKADTKDEAATEVVG